MPANLTARTKTASHRINSRVWNLPALRFSVLRSIARLPAKRKGQNEERKAAGAAGQADHIGIDTSVSRRRKVQIDSMRVADGGSEID
jgi:hypothetical protein